MPAWSKVELARALCSLPPQRKKLPPLPNTTDRMCSWCWGHGWILEMMNGERHVLIRVTCPKCDDRHF